MNADESRDALTGADSPESKRFWAEEGHAWLIAYLEAGFSREEGMQLIVASQSRSTMTTAAMSPEMSELVAKMSALLNRDLSE